MLAHRLALNVIKCLSIMRLVILRGGSFMKIMIVHILHTDMMRLNAIQYIRLMMNVLSVGGPAEVHLLGLNLELFVMDIIN